MDLLTKLFKGDRAIWIIFTLLCAISIVEVFSAASTLTYKTGDQWGPITRHATFLVIGFVLVVIFHHISYGWFQALPALLLFIAIPFLLLLLIFDNLNLGGILVIENVNNAGRWVKLFGIPFQPSELAKMAIVITTARTLARGQTEEGVSKETFYWVLAVALFVVFLIVPENYSTGALLALTVYLMMIVGRVQWKRLLAIAGITFGAVSLFVAFLFLTPNDTLKKIPLGGRFTTVKARISDYTDRRQIPAAQFDIDDNGQVAHARIAVATSHLIGKGPGNSVQRDFLSQAFSDFIFAIIIEELGLIPAAGVVILYIWLLIRAGRIARKCKRSFPAFLVTGIALLLACQALFNMMVAVGLVPVTGQPLPLISRGGTSTIINCLYIGMILSVSRYTAALEEEQRRLEAQRLHDQQVPMEISVGGTEQPADSQAQSMSAPTSEALNGDAELE